MAPSKKEERRLHKGKYVIPKLFKTANKHHRQIDPLWRGALEHAKKCGEALVKARDYYPLRSKMWRRHVEEHFDASYETAKVYMRIARKWDDPRLAEARRHGFKLKSIQKVLDVLKYRPDPEDGRPNRPTAGMIRSMTRQDIRESFKKALQELSKYELQLFDMEFDYYWEKIRKMLYHDVCIVMEQDLDEFLLETRKKPKDYNPKYRREAIKGPSKQVIDWDMMENRVKERQDEKRKAREKTKKEKKTSVKKKTKKKAKAKKKSK